MNENKSAGRTVAQKMGVKENSRAFFVNPEEEAINNNKFPPLDISTQLVEGKVYNNKYGKLNGESRIRNNSKMKNEKRK